jgi:hypothetical protein
LAVVKTTHIISCIAIVVCGCGYHAVNTTQLYGFDTIAVVPFLEDVPAGLSSELASDLSARLAAGGLHVVGDESAAGAVLTGRVINATSAVSPVAHFGGSVPAYDLIVSLVVDLVPQGQKPVWHRQFVVREDFLAAQPTTLPASGSPLPPSDITLATEANRRRALARVAATASGEIVDALLLDSTVRREAH